MTTYWAPCYSAVRNMENRTGRKGMVALTALGLLSERPCHPYEIQRLMRDRHKDYAIGKTRDLYRAIEELEAAGYIETVQTFRDGRRPERTVYKITAEGCEELQNWLNDLLGRPIVEHRAFNVAIGLICYLDQDRAMAALAARCVALQAELAALDEALHALQEQLHLPRLVLLEEEHAKALREAELRWVRSIIDDIREGKLTWNEEILREHFEAMHEAETARRFISAGHAAAAPPEEAP